jgi:deoxyribodipyrimidine photolyase
MEFIYYIIHAFSNDQEALEYIMLLLIRKNAKLPIIKHLVETLNVKNVQHALYESTTDLEITKYLADQCTADDINTALTNKSHKTHIKEHLIWKGGRYKDWGNYKNQISDLLKNGLGIVLNTHPQCQVFKISQPYVVRQRGIHAILKQFLPYVVADSIIDYVLYERISHVS